MDEQKAQEAQETAAQEADGAQEATQSETDWQAKYEEMRSHSREWEKRAKENAAAAAELEDLKQAQLTEQEKATARAEKAEAELAALKAEAELAEAARQLSEKTGVPLALLEFCKDAEAMDEFARVYAEKQPAVHAAGKASASKVAVGGKTSSSDLFAATAERFFTKG